VVRASRRPSFLSVRSSFWFARWWSKVDSFLSSGDDLLTAAGKRRSDSRQVGSSLLFGLFGGFGGKRYSTLSRSIGHIPVAAKERRIVRFVKLSHQESQNNRKKSPFLIGTSPWLRWVKFASFFEYALANGLKQTTSSGCSVWVL
jgi:hypothetical protein